MRLLRRAALLAAAALAAVVAGAVAVLLWLRLPAPPAHRVFLNGTVLTMDAANRVTAAVSVRADRIDAVGTNDEIRRSIGPDTVVVDLGGRTLLPGFIDGAWQIRHEHDRGSIEPGKFADLVVLSGDPRADPETIRALRVLETIVGGRTIYAAAGSGSDG